jgi:hypothetical protein
VYLGASALFWPFSLAPVSAVTGAITSRSRDGLGVSRIRSPFRPDCTELAGEGDSVPHLWREEEGLAQDILEDERMPLTEDAQGGGACAGRHGLCVDVLRIGRAAWHSSLDRADFGGKIWNAFSLAPAMKRDLTFSLYAHRAGLPRVLFDETRAQGQALVKPGDFPPWCGKDTIGCVYEELSMEVARKWSDLLSGDFLPRVALCKWRGAGGAAAVASSREVMAASAEGGWMLDGEQWRAWTRTAYERVARVAALSNNPSLSFLLRPGGDSSGIEKGSGGARGGEAGGGEQAFDKRWGVGVKRWEEIAVAVMNQPDANADRLRHMQALTHDMGWLHVSFPRTAKWSDLNLQHLVESGVVSPLLQTRFDEYREGIDQKGQMMYVANAMDQVSQVRAAAEKGQAVIVLEDDLLLSDSVSATRETLARVFDEIPDTADVVYLEFCFETCDQLRYRPGAYPTRAASRLARAYAPSCSAAVLFTAKGARKVGSLAWPIFDVIDRMYQYLVVTDLVEACTCLQKSPHPPHCAPIHTCSDARGVQTWSRPRSSTKMSTGDPTGFVPQKAGAPIACISPSVHHVAGR